MRHCAASVVISIVGLLFAGASAAQLVDVPAILDPDKQAPPMTAILQYGHQFRADVEDSGTKMSRDTVFFGIGHRAQLGKKTTLFTVANYTLHAYDFAGDSGPTNRYRWDDVHRGVLGSFLGQDVGEHFRLIGGAVLRSWAEGGADFGDSISGGLFAGFDYHTGDDFSVGLLVGGFSQLGGGVGLLPVPMLKWKMTDALRLDVGMVQVIDPGLGAQLAYQITPAVSIGTGFTYQTRQYRLADRERIAGRPDHPNRTDDGGIGQESELPIFVSLRWKPTTTSSIDLMTGAAVGGNLRVEDADGNRIVDDDYEAAPFVGLKGQLLF